MVTHPLKPPPFPYHEAVFKPSPEHAGAQGVEGSVGWSPRQKMESKAGQWGRACAGVGCVWCGVVVGGGLDYPGRESSPPQGCASDITVGFSGYQGNSSQTSFTDELGR